jgi:uncharacterized protein YqhQ
MSKKSPQAILAVVISALDEISRLTKNTHDNEAVGVLKVIEAIVEALQSGLHGKVTPKDVEAALTSLRLALRKNHEHAEQAIHDKFDSGDD